MKQRWTTRTLVAVVAVVAIGSGSAAPAGAAAWDPFPTATAMVDTQYLDFLDRLPTTIERSTWVSRLTAGTHSRGALVASLRDSSDNLTYVDPVARLYWSALVRPPDRPGLDYWVGQRRSGARTLQQVADHFVTTTEYAGEYGGTTNMQFVNLLYSNVTGGPGDATGVAYWVGALSGGESRASVIRRFQEAPGSIAHLRVEVNVSVSVIAMFQRNPTMVDISSYGWLGPYPASLAEAMFLSTEYHYP